MLLERGHRANRHVDLAGEQVAHHRAFAAIGHMQDIDAVGLVEVGLDGVRLRARAPGAHAQLAGFLLGISDQFRHGFHRQRAVDGQHRARHGDVGHLAQVGARVVGQLLVEGEVGGDRAGDGQQQRVAIGRRLGHIVGADDAAGAAFVFHHHGLSQPFAQAFG